MTDRSNRTNATAHTNSARIPDKPRSSRFWLILALTAFALANAAIVGSIPVYDKTGALGATTAMMLTGGTMGLLFIFAGNRAEQAEAAGR